MLKVAAAVNTGICNASAIAVYPFIGARENVVHIGTVCHGKKFAATHIGVVHGALAAQLRISREGVGKYLRVEWAIRALRRCAPVGCGLIVHVFRHVVAPRRMYSTQLFK